MRILPLIALLAGACTTATVDPVAPRYQIIAYVHPRTEIHRISAEKLTHINYAFAQVSLEGEVVLTDPDAPALLAQLQALKARNPRLKLILSVGGWGADNFSDAALTEESRAKFAASAIALVKRYALDGIDLDWEYPGQPGPGIKFRPEDKENFTLMLKAMRDHLNVLSAERGGDSGYTLSIASSADEYFEHTEMDKLHVYLDWINIMAYDFTGGWTDTTGHHAALYGPSPSGASFVKQHLDAGIPRRKLILGVPFYGRGWSGVGPENNGLQQRYESSVSDLSYSKLLAESINRQGFIRYWDHAAKAPYLWNPDSRTFISYDDPESLEEKTRLVKEHGLGGMMYWEHSHDPGEVLLDVLYSRLNAGRRPRSPSTHRSR